METLAIVGLVVFFVFALLTVLGAIHPKLGFAKTRGGAVKRNAAVALIGLVAVFVFIGMGKRAIDDPEHVVSPAVKSTPEASEPIPQPTKASVQQSKSQAEPEAKPKPAPGGQRKFVALVESFYPRYKNAANELQKSTLRRERKQALKQLFPSLDRQGWRGTIVDLGTNTDGNAYISVELEGSNILIQTSNNAFSDSGYGTLIAVGSSVYDTLMNATDGQRVEVDVRFLPDQLDEDHVKEQSITEFGSMLEPEFLVKFVRVQLL